MPIKQRSDKFSHGSVEGVEYNEGGMYLAVCAEGEDRFSRVWVSHEMQMLMLKNITDHLGGKARQLAWIKNGGPVPESEME